MAPEATLIDGTSGVSSPARRATTWSIRDDRLQLREADGALQADFRVGND